MNALNNQADAGLEQLGPYLDEAINQLATEDRRAVLLRFYEQRDLRSVGEAMGISENAAQKRVSRALEELRTGLGRHGLACSAAALAAVLTAGAVSAAPAGMAVSIAGTALAAAATGGGSLLGLFKLISMMKFKSGVISALALASVAAPLVVPARSFSTLGCKRLRGRSNRMLSALRGPLPSALAQGWLEACLRA